MILVSDIPLFVLANDDLYIDFTTDAYKLTPGSKAYVTFAVTTRPVAGHFLTFRYNDVEMVFSIVASPDDSGLQILQAHPFQDYGDWIEDVLCPALNANFDFACLFIAERNSYSSPLARIITKQNMHLTSIEVANSAAFFQTGFGLGSAETYAPNFRINVELGTASGSPLGLGYRAYEPDADGKVSVNLKQFMGTLAENRFNLQVGTLMELPYDVRKIRLRYWESYGLADEFTHRKINFTGQFSVINGGTSYIEQAKRNDIGITWYDQQLSTKAFLTRMPVARNLLPGTPLLLRFLMLQGSGGIRVYTRKVFSIYETTESIGSINGSIGQMFQIKVPFDNWGTDLQRFDLWVTDHQGLVISETRTYNIDRAYYENLRFMFFRNSLGGFDTLQALGRGLIESEYNRTRVLNDTPKQYKSTDRETETKQVQETMQYKINLGFLAMYGDDKLSWANYIRQIYSTTEGYEVINGDLVPIDITTTKAQLLDDNNDLPDMELEYTRAFVEKAAPSAIPPLKGQYNEQYINQYLGGYSDLLSLEGSAPGEVTP